MQRRPVDLNWDGRTIFLDEIGELRWTLRLHL